MEGPYGFGDNLKDSVCESGDLIQCRSLEQIQVRSSDLIAMSGFFDGS